MGVYDGRKLGPWFEKLRAPMPGMMLFGGLMLNREAIYHFLNMKRSLKSLWYCTRLILRFMKDRLSYSRGTRLVIGNAMMAALLRAALNHGVKFEFGVEAQSFVTDEAGRVTGIVAKMKDGRTTTIAARQGVVLGTGGLSRNPCVLEDRPDTRDDHLSMAAPNATGAMMFLAEKQLGAKIGGNLAGNFYWAPMSQVKHADGTLETFPHIVTDRAKPGVIAVTEKGERFTNEGDSYHRFVKGMMEQQRQGVRRFYLISDHRALRAYGLGLARPSPGVNTALEKNGYLIKAQTIGELARLIDIDPNALEATIAEHNRDAENGYDTKFQKGESSYNKAQGDMTLRNAGMAPIVNAPFYAVRIYTGDLGSAKGLATDGKARVLRQDGSVIPGLYAVGSDMNSMMSGTYPGPGITLGPGLTFGYVAARTMAEDADA
jgi:succinate dehydrogenase/fumarate reductase flavoprotein subunit